MVAPVRLRGPSNPTPLYRRDAPTLDQARAGQVIRFGMRGDAVKELQSALVLRGIPLKEDGLFGSKTQEAVNTFQRERGLKVDGLVGPRTLEALFAPVPTDGAGAVRTGEARAPTVAERRVAPTGTEVRAADLVRNDAFRRATRTREGAPTTRPPMVELSSPNRSSRGGAQIDTLVLHDTGSNSTEGALSWLRNPNSGVSAHYVIGKDGTIYNLVPDRMNAWHAGRSSLRGDRSPSVNARSIGIEIVNDGGGRTPFTEAQYASLERLVPHLVQTHGIPMANVVGHKDVASGRKGDPAPNFDWARIGLDDARFA